MNPAPPGPWSIESYRVDGNGSVAWSHCEIGFGTDPTYGDGPERIIARIDLNAPTAGEREAIARLMTAAPTMLDALRTAIDSLDEDGTTDTREAMRVVRSAISYATGAK